MSEHSNIWSCNKISNKSSVSFLQIENYFFQILEVLTEQESLETYYMTSGSHHESLSFFDKIGLFQNEVYFVRYYNDKSFSGKYEVRNLEQFKMWSTSTLKRKYLTKDDKKLIKDWSDIVIDKMIQHKREHKINEILNPKIEDIIYLAC